MIDFSTLKGLTIPVGNVILTIERTYQMQDVHHTWFVINGQTYDGGESVPGDNYSLPTYVSADVGTKVLCCIEMNIADTTERKVNNELVELIPSTDNTYLYYEYTVRGNATLAITEMDNGTLYTGGFNISDTPAGVVKQISDAQGNVLWSAVVPETTLIIRTVGDCTDGVATKYPTDATSFSSLVNEEIADDDATYIKLGATGTQSTSGYKYDHIKLADVVDFPKGSIVSAYLFARVYCESNTSMALRWSTSQESTVGYTSTTAAYEDVTAVAHDEYLTALNEYISQNKKLPSFSVQFKVTCSAPKTAYVRITQVYLSLTFKGR